MENNTTPEMLYYAAEDFVALNYSQKFNVGLELNLITHVSDFTDEEQLEAEIFTAMYRRHKFKEFVKLLYTVKYE